MDQGPPRRRRARPVADAPVDALLERSEDLTKGWLVALLEEAPLDEAPGILAADLARDGPRVCAAVVRALASDEDLRRLEPGGALELIASQTGELAGARGVGATSRAVETLGSVIWSGLRGALPRPDPDQISELAERLALVIDSVRGAALRRCAAQTPSVIAAGPAVAARRADAPPAAEADPDPAPTETAEPGSGHVATPPAGASAPRPSPPALRDVNSGISADRPVDATVNTLWAGAVEDEILRSAQSGTPLSLLLVELEEADRMVAVESPAQASATFGSFAQAVRSTVRRQDILACETETRAWIIARDTGRLGAQALGARIVGSVRSAEPWRGAPMTVSVGLAVLGDDGHDHESLIEAAEESRFAAAASGVDMQERRPED